MNALESVTDATFEQRVLKSARPVVIDFTAAWCAPCKSMLPGLIDLAKEYEGEMDIVAINIDENPNVVAKFNIRSVPTFVFLKDSQVVNTVSGSMSRLQMAKLIDDMLEEV